MNLVTEELDSMVRLRACCASAVRASPSSRNMSLNGTSVRAEERAKSFILPLTTSMPLSSLAFSSRKLPETAPEYISCASARQHVVFPTPGGPAKRRFGMFFVRTNALRLSTMSFWPTTSSSLFGLYFSVHGSMSEFLRSIVSNPYMQFYINVYKFYPID